MLLRNCANFRVFAPHFGSNQSYHNSRLKNSKWREKIKVFQITMLLVLVGLFVGLLGLFYWSRRKFLGLPGAGLQLPLIGHYQVSHGFWLVIARSVKASDWSLPAQSIGFSLDITRSLRLMNGHYQVSQGFWLVITRSVKASKWTLPGQSRLLIGHYQVSQGFWLVSTRSVKASDWSLPGQSRLLIGHYQLSLGFWLVLTRSVKASDWSLPGQSRVLICH